MLLISLETFTCKINDLNYEVTFGVNGSPGWNPSIAIAGRGSRPPMIPGGQGKTDENEWMKYTYWNLLEIEASKTDIPACCVQRHAGTHAA